MKIEVFSNKFMNQSTLFKLAVTEVAAAVPDYGKLNKLLTAV